MVVITSKMEENLSRKKEKEVIVRNWKKKEN